jgi:Flp pilus assembly protein TadB
MAGMEKKPFNEMLGVLGQVAWEASLWIAVIAALLYGRMGLAIAALVAWSLIPVLFWAGRLLKRPKDTTPELSD